MITLLFLTSCSTTQEVKTQQYAILKNERDYPQTLPEIWGGIESSLKKHKILKREPETVTPVEYKELKQRALETDWIYGRSENKFIEYKMNNLPKKKYLNTRHKFIVTAQSKIGGSKVLVETVEEVEELNEDGESKGYSSSYAPDSKKAHLLLDEIRMALYAR